MENKIIFLEPLFEKAEDFAKTNIELLKLQAVEKSAQFISVIVSRGLVIIVLLMLIGSLSTGVSIWLGELLGKMYLGFFCVAGVYGIVASVLYFMMNNQIKRRVSDSFISQILN